MIRRSLEQIAVMCGGQTSHPSELINGVSTDTRSVSPGNLYVPLVGKRVNGHDFGEQAAIGGAAAALWNVRQPGPRPDLPLVLVEDTLVALQRLAANYRRQLSAKVIGITGSNGKTSVKDILAALLAVKFRTQCTPGNLNSEVGLPLTLLSLDEDVEMAVVEMGMSGLGEIRLLSQLAAPDMAIITSIGEAHLADLGSLEKIAEAKLEILDGLAPGGLFIANGDCQLLQAAIHSRQTVTFGGGADSDFHPTEVNWRAEGMGFRIGQAGDLQFFLPLFGRHQVVNALAAIAAAHSLQLSYAEISAGMLAVQPTGQRGRLVRRGNLTIIDDTYKSNPPSAMAALDTLYSLSGYGRKVAVLGDMRDLGAEEKSLHTTIGKLLDPEQLDLVITIGPAAQQIAKVAQPHFPAERVLEASGKDEVITLLKQRIGSEPALLLVKGAHALALDELVSALRKE